MIYLSTSEHLDALDESLVEDVPKDGGHEAVDEEVDGRVDHHCQLRKVSHEQNPKRQAVAVVTQGFFVLLNCENLKLMKIN